MPDDKDRKESAGVVYQAVTLGMVFPIAIGVGFFAGRWMDGLFHTAPWMTAIFSGLGIAAGFVNLFKSGTSTDGQ